MDRPQEPKQPNSPNPPPQAPRFRFNLFYLLFAIWGVLLIQNFITWQDQVSEVAYSEFIKQLDAGNVTEVTKRGERLHGVLKEPVNGKQEFMTVQVDPELTKLLAAHNVKFGEVIESTFLRDVMSWVIPTLIFLGIWMFLLRRMQSNMSGGAMSLGKNKAKVYVEQDIKTTFKDVAGVDEAKDELREVVGFLKDPKAYERLGAHIPKGVLLVGPPGTGKTLLAKAVAGEAGVAFFSINGSEFVEMFVGLGAARVRDLFEQARKQAPCIIFIDELDALGKTRNSPLASGHDEKEQTLNQLLVEMDGFDSSIGTIILAATNRPEILDPALLRAGRFDRQVLVDRPDRKGRLEILKVHVVKVKLDPSLELEKVADLTPGFTGADLANLVNEAAIVATRRHAETVNLSDFTQALERIVAGLEKRSRLLDPRERMIVAHHEMGHALVAAALPNSDPVHKISIIPRGMGALGYTLQRPTGDRYLITEQELRNKISVLMGGRAAEILVFGHLSTGASDDLQKATNIAREMVTRYGMNRMLGSVSYNDNEATLLSGGADFPFTKSYYSDKTAREIDESVKNITESALAEALQILTNNENLLRKSAQHLLEKETLEEKELKKIFSQLQKHTQEHLEPISIPGRGGIPPFEIHSHRPQQ